MKPKSNIGNSQRGRGDIFTPSCIAPTYASKFHIETVKEGSNRLGSLKLGPKDPHDNNIVITCSYLGVKLIFTRKPYK